MSNAFEFIAAYNEIDARLRAIYKGKGNLQFSDLIRRCAEFNATVKRYEDELASYARLRNAIVHNSTKKSGSSPNRAPKRPKKFVTLPICFAARPVCKI